MKTLILLSLALILNTARAVAGQTFATPDEAAAALGAAAAKADGGASLRTLFGSDADALLAGDKVQLTNELAEFTAAFTTTNCLVHDSATRCTLEVVSQQWPFPVPISLKNGRWEFEAAAAKDQLLTRRIGQNELATIACVHAYVRAQREYASQDRDADRVLEFARKLISSPGKKDGLFWPPDLDGEISPLGPLVAYAQSRGYGSRRNQVEGETETEPYNGYYFKILTAQGSHAPGGKHSFFINDKMIAGFGLVAWPANYGESGIMSFIVNQEGRIFQKNLGAATAKIAGAMKSYDPDDSWAPSPD